MKKVIFLLVFLSCFYSGFTQVVHVSLATPTGNGNFEQLDNNIPDLRAINRNCDNLFIVIKNNQIILNELCNRLIVAKLDKDDAEFLSRQINKLSKSDRRNVILGNQMYLFKPYGLFTDSHNNYLGFYFHGMLVVVYNGDETIIKEADD